MISLVVYGEPAPAGSKTAGVTKTGRTFVRDSSKRSYPWKKTVAQVAGARMQGLDLLDGPLVLHVDFYMPRPKGHYGSGKNTGIVRASAPRFPTVKPDATKLLRGLEDSLTKIVWRDDAQVVEQHVRKLYGEPARAEITVGLISESSAQSEAA